MELPLIFRAPNPPLSFFTGSKACAFHEFPVNFIKKKKRKAAGIAVVRVKATVERTGSGGDAVDGGAAERDSAAAGAAGTFTGVTGPTMEVTTLNQTFREAELPVWEKIGAIVRLSYGIGELLLITFLEFPATL